MEPFCHTQSCDPYQISMFKPSDVCAKFCEFSSIPSPSKITSCFMPKNVLPCQQLSMKAHNLHNKADMMNLVH